VCVFVCVCLYVNCVLVFDSELEPEEVVLPLLFAGRRVSLFLLVCVYVNCVLVCDSDLEPEEVMLPLLLAGR